MSSPRANSSGQGKRGARGGSNNMLLELIDRILDKGIVIDAWARISLLSIELITIEARVVVASVETYLRYAEAIGNTALASMPNPQGQAQMPQQAAQGALPAAQGAQPAQITQQPAQQVNGYAPAQPQQIQQPQQVQQPQQMQQPQQAQPAPQQPQQQNSRQR